MGRKRLSDDAKLRTVLIKASGRLWAEVEGVLLPGETVSHLARAAIEAEVVRRRNDAALNDARNVLKIYEALVKRSEEDRAKILARKAGELEQMRDRVVEAVGAILGKHAQPAPEAEPEPSIDDLFGQ